MAFKVRLNDGRALELPDPTMGDLVAFERKFGVPASKLQQEQYAEWVSYLVWLGLRRTANGQIPDDFEAFLLSLDTVEMTDRGKDETPAPSPA